MKSLKILFFVGFLTFLCSCTIEKRLHLSGYHIDWKNKKNTSENKKSLDNNSFATIKIQKKETTEIPTAKNAIRDAVNESPIDESFLASNEVVINHSITHKKALEDCDIIVSKDGDEILGIVTEIGLDEIKYKKCNNPDGPIFSIKKVDVFMIKYRNGNKDIFKTENYFESQVSRNKSVERFFKINGIGLSAFIISIVGLFKFQIILGFISIILGIIGLINFSEDTEAEKVEVFGILAIVIGVIDIIVGLLILALIAIFS